MTARAHYIVALKNAQGHVLRKTVHEYRYEALHRAAGLERVYPRPDFTVTITREPAEAGTTNVS